MTDPSRGSNGQASTQLFQYPRTGTSSIHQARAAQHDGE